MAKLSSLLNQRFLKKDKSKMTALVKKREEGALSSFAGIFGAAQPSDKEREELTELLKSYALHEGFDFSDDLSILLSITSEVKAINNQAAILHGERIKKAQTILKRYRDGAFTAWLISTYGNRQTPYNFLQYYEFYSNMPKELHGQIETMPRQAIYTLASREGAREKKEELIRNYKGETKQQMITLIRSLFPLKEKDKRQANLGEGALSMVTRLITTFEHQTLTLTKKQKESLIEQIDHLRSLVNKTRIK